MSTFSVHGMGGKIPIIAAPAGITPITGNVAITAVVGTYAAGARTQSITIPSGARFAVIVFGGYSGDGTIDFTSISLDAVPAELIGNSNTVANDSYDVALAWVALGAGNEGASKTLAWTNSRQCTEGGNVLVRFYSGWAASLPVRSSGVAGIASTDTVTPGALTALTGDLAIAVYCSSGNDSGSWTNATEIFKVNGEGVCTSLAEASPTGNITISATGSYPGLVVAIIKP